MTAVDDPPSLPSLSAYDDAIPHPTLEPSLAARFAALRSQRPGIDLTALTEVVLVVSSSRAGSTMLGGLLRGCEHLLALPAEMNAYVTIAQLAGDDRDVLAAELGREVGRPASRSQIEQDEFIRAVRWRLLAQWPHLDPDPDHVAIAVRRAARLLSPCDPAFTVGFLRELTAVGFAVDRARYEVCGGKSRGRRQPPVSPVIEMAPYVAFRPWRLATADELASRPLVIVTPRNAYRLDLLRSLLPAASLRVLHLTRNPAASVNGLADGWQHPDFHSAAMPEPLRIRGYSDAVPGGELWWKFDVPPQWPDVVDGSLAEVCAMQWWSPHERVLDDTSRLGLDYLQVRYEDLVGAPATRIGLGDRLAEWLGVPAAPFVDAVLAGLPPTMATAPPRRRRWRAAGNDLAPALAQPKVWEVAARLGYDPDEQLWI